MTNILLKTIAVFGASLYKQDALYFFLLLIQIKHPSGLALSDHRFGLQFDTQHNLVVFYVAAPLVDQFTRVNEICISPSDPKV